MALADTARLVASLELQDKFTGTANKFDRAIGGMDKTLGNLGRNLRNIGLAGFGLLAANVAAGIATIARLEEVTAATNAVITSTGGSAGVTAQQVRDLAEEYENLNATMDDKVIQSAENVLLTFTNVTEKAFEPALEAALNLNQALGGGEEGLQGNIILVGKALNDPIRGLTALRRVGVGFSQTQEDQIKLLVEQNDLYGAQQVILGELTTQFGGQFAAAGTTATAKFARLKDAIEDAQVALATAFLPSLEKVGERLTTLLQDPQAIAALEDLGENLADAFDAIVEIAGNLPWSAIGDAFKLMGTGSKALLQAFTQLPPWVQTAVLTGWGLNKLTGGALGSIVGTLASGLIKGVLGINAGIVNVNGPVAGGGGVGAAGAAGGARAGVGNVIRIVGSATIFTGIAVALGELIAQNVTRPLDPEKFDFNAVAGASGLFSRPEDANRFIADLSRELGVTQLEVKAAIVEAVNNNGLTFTEAVNQLQGKLVKSGQDTQARLREGVSADQKQTEQLRQNLSVVAAARAEASSAATRNLQSQSAALVKLQQIAAKNFSPTVSVSVTSSVTISDIQRRITSQQIAIGRGPLEF